MSKYEKGWIVLELREGVLYLEWNGVPTIDACIFPEPCLTLFVEIEKNKRKDFATKDANGISLPY